MLKRTSLVACGLALVVTACGGSQKDVMSAHDAGKGDERVYDVPLDKAWEASRAALKWNHAEAIEEHRDKGYMFGSAPTSMWSYGAAMGVWLAPVGDAATKVRVVVSRAGSLNVTGQTEGGLQADVAKAVALEKAGKPLPDSAP